MMQRTLLPPSSDRAGRSFRSPRMRVLCVVSSSNQLYSGIGRALFELAKRLADRVEYQFAIDRTHAKNVNLLTDFCETNGFRLHVGAGRPTRDALDARNLDLPGLMRQGGWDAVECLCWANTGTNASVLDELADVPLVYTPHHQPSWTVPMSPAQAERIESVHQRMLERSDLVLCDSPWEQRELQARVPGRDNCVFLPLGCHFEAFQPGPPRRRQQLLFVGDLTEPRKRFDRVLNVFSIIRERHPGLRLVVVGNRTDQVGQVIPDFLRPACDLRGYVSEAELRQAYAESQAFLLLSDFEAFGIPILEALACGTPVFLTDLEATRSLFGAFRGAHFCPGRNLDETLTIVSDTLARGPDAVREALADRTRLRATFDWDALAERKWQAMAATWFRKRYCA